MSYSFSNDIWITTVVKVQTQLGGILDNWSVQNKIKW